MICDWFMVPVKLQNPLVSAVRYMALGLFLLPFGLRGNPPPGRPDAILYNTPYVELRTIAAQLGMRYEQSGDKNRCTLSSRWTKLEFSVNSRLMHLNKFKVFLGHAVAQNRGKLYLSTHDLDKTLNPLLTPQVFSSKPKLKKIVLDPGHGGKDPGCANKKLGMVEKEMTLDLARRLKESLEKKGYQVMLTRDSDRFVENSNRSKFANNLDADLFLALHFNSVTSTSVQGIETYAFTPMGQPSTARSQLSKSDKRTSPANRYDPWNALAGFYVQRQLIRTMRGVDRGLKRARFSMLSGLNCPGLLVEGGFFQPPRRSQKNQIFQVSHKTCRCNCHGN